MRPVREVLADGVAVGAAAVKADVVLVVQVVHAVDGVVHGALPERGGNAEVNQTLNGIE